MLLAEIRPLEVEAEQVEVLVNGLKGERERQVWTEFLEELRRDIAHKSDVIAELNSETPISV